jgi:hypothetical protein
MISILPKFEDTFVGIFRGHLFILVPTVLLSISMHLETPASIELAVTQIDS